MMKFHKMTALACCAAGLLFSAACNNDYVGKEHSHPLFAKGLSCKTSQNYSKAADAFEGFLVLCPKSARAHKELAGLYGDYLGDYLKAVYHYDKYLELAKPGTLDAQDIHKLIDSNKRKFYEKYQQDNGLTNPEPLQAGTQPADEERIRMLESSLNAQKEINTQIAEKYRALIKVNEKLFNENKLMRERIQNAFARTNTAASVRTGTAPQTGASDTTYTVRKGDSLYSIAKSVYGTSSSWTKIRDANLAIVGEKGIVKEGQVLRIPKLSAAGTPVRTAAPKKTASPAVSD